LVPIQLGQGEVIWVINMQVSRRKALASLLMLIFGSYGTRETAMFHHVSSMPTTMSVKIKNEAMLWAVAGAKDLSSNMPRACTFVSE
jgi:hypothetical protein